MGKFTAIIEKNSDSKIPFDPLVWIALTSHGKKDGSIIISGSMASKSEIDFTINQFIDDLEFVRKEATRKLHNQRSKILKGKKDQA
jgi:hypothetical protein